MKKLLMTLVVALLIASPSHAAVVVFDVTGVTDLSGTVTIDNTLGTVTAADLDYSVNSPPDYQDLISATSAGSDFLVTAANGTSPGFDVIEISFATGKPSGSLIGFQGGSIDAVVFGSDCSFETGCAGTADLTLNNAALTPTPLPAALPLFATGIGALGLLGWRRKRKTQGRVVYRST